MMNTENRPTKLSDLGNRAQVMRAYGDALLSAVIHRRQDLFDAASSTDRRSGLSTQPPGDSK
jgi:hypothetical protein